MKSVLRLAGTLLLWFTCCYYSFLKQGDLKFSEYITSLLPLRYTSELTVFEEQEDAVICALRLYSGNGFNLHAQIRNPRIPGKVPAILLLGGMMTGKKAVEYAYHIDHVLLISPDYPYEVRSKYNIWTMLSDIHKAHQALHLQIRDNLVLLDFLRTWDRIDTSKISLIGYSFGVPFACATAELDKKLKGLALIYGGADLKYLLQKNLKLYHSFVDEVLIHLFGVFLSDFEPSRHAANLKLLPVILINGEFDKKIPEESARSLQNAIPFEKTVIWLPTDHVHPKNRSLSLEIITHLRQWYKEHNLN